MCYHVLIIFCPLYHGESLNHGNRWQPINVKELPLKPEVGPQNHSFKRCPRQGMTCWVRHVKNLQADLSNLKTVPFVVTHRTVS